MALCRPNLHYSDNMKLDQTLPVNKVVCVKKCSYSLNYSNYPIEYRLNIGDVYELSWQQPSPDKISIVITYDEIKYNLTVMKSDFISLEQWRDKQLNELGI